MKKIIKLNENDIENLVKKIIKEEENLDKLPYRERKRKETSFRRQDFEPYKREDDIKSVFGKYGEDLPPQVLQYIRKNPKSIINRLVGVYGIDKIIDFINTSED
jgi:hypothetical protein